MFDLKLGENRRHKTHFGADRHNLPASDSVMYSYIVSRDSMWSMLMVEALDWLYLK